MTKAPVLEKPEVKVSDAPAFGAYSSAVIAPCAHDDRSSAQAVSNPLRKDSKIAFAHPPPVQSRADNSEAGVNNWFRRHGIFTTDPVDMKRIWSPSFARHYEARRWDETYKGRLAMRLVSRSIVGAVFYTAAQLYGASTLGMGGYTNHGKPKGVLQHIARFIDNTAGKAIYGTVKILTGDEDKALSSVMFRDTRSLGYKKADGSPIKGRSLGDDMVNVTFDFAAMSLGDYLTRWVIELFDKHNRVKLVKNGRLDIAGGLKEFGQALWRGVTYAAGEDMAVALPYVYFMRFLRKVLDKVMPGFKYDSDRSRFGGSFMVDDQNRITGDYQLAGVLDFTGRFTFYNVLTKMYRDLYARVTRKVDEWKHGDKALPKEQLTFAQKIKKSLMYVAVTVTKTTFYMLPASFLFGILRAPVSRRMAIAIHPHTGAVSDIKDVIGDRDEAYSDSIYAGKAPWQNKLFNPIGISSYKLGEAANNAYQFVCGTFGVNLTNSKMPNFTSREFFHRAVDAGLAYGPYVAAKSDVAAPYLDTNRTNFVLTGFYRSLWKTAKAAVSFDRKKLIPAAKDLGEWWDEACLAMLKQPSPRYEPQIQQVMNDEGYKLSNEAYELDLDRLTHREVHREEEKNGIRQSVTPEPAGNPARKSYAESLRKASPPDSYIERTQKAPERRPIAKRTFDDFATLPASPSQTIH